MKSRDVEQQSSSAMNTILTELHKLDHHRQKQQTSSSSSSSLPSSMATTFQAANINNNTKRPPRFSRPAAQNNRQHQPAATTTTTTGSFELINHQQFEINNNMASLMNQNQQQPISHPNRATKTTKKASRSSRASAAAAAAIAAQHQTASAVGNDLQLINNKTHMMNVMAAAMDLGVGVGHAAVGCDYSMSILPTTTTSNFANGTGPGYLMSCSAAGDSVSSTVINTDTSSSSSSSMLETSRYIYHSASSTSSSSSSSSSSSLSSSLNPNLAAYSSTPYILGAAHNQPFETAFYPK